MMFEAMDQIITNPGNPYLIRLQGALSSRAIDWCGGVTIITQEQGDTLVNLSIKVDSLRDFLDQFQELCLTVLPDEGFENEILYEYIDRQSV
jgi:hypothetical protein